MSDKGALKIWGILLLTCVSCPVFAEEAVKPESPAYIYNSAFENERVTVIRVRLKPGDKIPMRSQPDHVVYITSPGKLRFAFPKGLPMVTETKIGEVYWSPAGSNSTENIGHTEVNAIVVELNDESFPKGHPAKKSPAQLVCPL